MSPSMPLASAQRDETARTGSSFAFASARAVAMPIRSPVNVPGPTPTAIASRSREVDVRLRHHVTDRRQELGRVRGALKEARRRWEYLELLAVGAEYAGARRRGRRVKAEDRHSASVTG